MYSDGLSINGGTHGLRKSGGAAQSPDGQRVDGSDGGMRAVIYTVSFSVWDDMSDDLAGDEECEVDGNSNHPADGGRRWVVCDREYGFECDGGKLKRSTPGVSRGWTVGGGAYILK